MTEVDTAYRLLEAGDARQAVIRLERAGVAGDAPSLVELGAWLLEGRYLPRNLARSRECFRQASELGNAIAQRVYICFLANGVGSEPDWQAAKERLRLFANEDAMARAQLELIEQMALDEAGNPKAAPVGRRLSTNPEITEFEGFASPSECSYLVERAEPLLQQSVVVDPGTGQLRPHPFRTSDGAAFPWASADMVITALNRRIAAASRTDVECGEPLQILRYGPGQEYRPHLDALPMEANQRVLTMLVYLNENFEGGETAFTRIGLTFRGKKAGDAVLFRNARPGSPPDPNAEHAGLPVVKGQKFIASRWIRERRIIAR